MMELKMTTDLDVALPKEILFNSEELKAELAERLSFYRNLLVTEDTIKEAKEDRAKLSKLKTALDDKRKYVKKQCMAPYTPFEAQIKELTGMIDEPIQAIDKQLAAFDEMRKEEKMKTVESMYAEIIPERCKEIIPLDRIFDGRWLNVGTTEQAIREALGERAKSVELAIMTIERLEPEYQAGCMAKYKETLDLGKAILHRDTLQATAESLNQYATTLNTAPEEKPVEKPVEPVRQEVTQEVAQPEPVQAAPAEKVYSATVKLRLTIPQWKTLQEYMEASGIGYERI